MEVIKEYQKVDCANFYPKANIAYSIAYTGNSSSYTVDQYQPSSVSELDLVENSFSI
jgi:L-fucose mutarotase/ribose pyranase (RbsD/FucU family)